MASKPKRVVLEVNNEVVFDEYVPVSGLDSKMNQLRAMGRNSQSWALYVQVKSKCNLGRKSPFTNADIQEMFELRQQGKTYKQIGRRFSCSGECVGKWLRKKEEKEIYQLA